MAEDHKLNINIRIGDRTYPMRVRPEEEELFRRSAKMVTERYNKYSQKLFDPLDRMAFVAFNIALQDTSNKTNSQVTIANEKLEELDKLIENELSK